MTNTAILILLVVFFGMLIFGVPICYAMLASAVITMSYLGLSMNLLISTLIDGIDGFTFLAVPFFVLAGEIMGQGGIAKRLIVLANAMVGWMRGGLVQVNIVASTFFGGISGSALADTASLGSILIPMMKEEGYDGEFSTAITMTSSVQGLLIPPSHNMVIYSMAAGGLSISALFMAGLTPGLLLGLALMIYTYFISKKRNYPKGEKFSVKRFLHASSDAIWGLGTVIVVVVGVLTGWYTATEAAAVACLWALIVSFVFYREIKFKAIFGIFSAAVKSFASVLLLCAAAGTFGFVISYLRIPKLVADAFLTLTANKYIILLLINLLILLLGMITGMSSIIIITTPILLPVLSAVGVSPIQYGAILILNCGIGLITPPVGGVLFMGSSISGIKIERLIKETFPQLLVMIVVLMLVTYIPAISLWPQMIGWLG